MLVLIPYYIAKNQAVTDNPLMHCFTREQYCCWILVLYMALTVDCRTRCAASIMQQHREQRQQHQYTDLSSTQFTNLTVDDPEITQRIGEFHRGLSTLENILCNVCLEKFPSIYVDTTGVCIHGRNDTKVPGL